MNAELPNFRRVVRGYDPESVETAWTELDQQITELNAANKELRLQATSLREQNTELRNRLREYEQLEKDLRDAMVSAQRISGQVRAESEQKAEELLQSAQSQAEAIINNAQQEATAKIHELDSLLMERNTGLEHLESELRTLTSEKEQIQEQIFRANQLLTTARDILGNS